MSFDTLAVVVSNFLVVVASLAVVAATVKDSNRTMLDGIRLILGKPPRHELPKPKPTTGEAFDIHA